MTLVLGISGLYHDAAAALVQDGEIICALQEERVSRVKNDARLPLQATQACLSHAGLSVSAIDQVVFYESPFFRLERVLKELLAEFPRSWRAFPQAIEAQLSHKIWVLDELSERLGVPRNKVTHVEHHQSHAASTFYTSGFPSAAVLTVDGVGELASTCVWHGKEGKLAKKAEIRFPHSLGLLYSALTSYLGFRVNEGEYKVMGLAAYGEAKFMAEFQKIAPVDEHGFKLDLSYFAFQRDTQLGYSRKLEALLGPARPHGVPWDLSLESDRRYASIACSLQTVLESHLRRLASYAREVTGESALCLAGGVALNAVAMSKLQGDDPEQPVYVVPPAGDAGGAIGAALLGAAEAGALTTRPLISTALGPSLNLTTLSETAQLLGLHVETLSDPQKHWCDSLERGEVFAFAHGRAEFGPRALGFRSIIADPESAETARRMNIEFKGREAFRPFAPAIHSESIPKYILEKPNALFPFMTGVATVKEPTLLGATTHIDGTARVQSVPASDGKTPGQSPALRLLLEEREKRGQTPAVLNTSLNRTGDPLAASAESVLSTMIETGLSTLYAADLKVTKKREGR